MPYIAIYVHNDGMERQGVKTEVAVYVAASLSSYSYIIMCMVSFYKSSHVASTFYYHSTYIASRE